MEDGRRLFRRRPWRRRNPWGMAAAAHGLASTHGIAAALDLAAAQGIAAANGVGMDWAGSFKDDACDTHRMGLPLGLVNLAHRIRRGSQKTPSRCDATVTPEGRQPAAAARSRCHAGAAHEGRDGAPP